MTSSGSGGTSDTFAGANSAVSLSTPWNAVSGTAQGTASSDTSYQETEYYFLDDNGAWQASTAPSDSGSGSGSGSGSSWFSSSGATWFCEGGGPYASSVYGNAVDGRLSASSGGSNSFQYTQDYSFQPNGPAGQPASPWLADGGSGSATGSGWTSAGFSAFGELYERPGPDRLFLGRRGRLVRQRLGERQRRDELQLRHQRRPTASSPAAAAPPALGARRARPRPRTAAHRIPRIAAARPTGQRPSG